MIALLALGLWLGRMLLPTSVTLVLVPTAAGEDLAKSAAELDGFLDAELAGISVVRYLTSENCRKRRRAFCLEPSLRLRQGRYETYAKLVDAASDHRVYATPRFAQADLAEVAAEISELVRTYFEVLGMEAFTTPDVKPWISFEKHDVRAIRDFLQGLDYVYRNEPGARYAYAAALERDPDFVAPWVWRTPSLAAEEDAETKARHRAALEGLFSRANSFEKPMIRWAIALIDGDKAAQIRHLRVTLDASPGNQPVRQMLALEYMEQQQYPEAWEILDPLRTEEWFFPGLYTAAGQCALRLGRVDDARESLEQGLELDAVDAESLALLRLLAIYDGDTAAEEDFGNRLEHRKAEIAPIVFDFDLSPFAEILADLADTEGNPARAGRLREFID